MLYLPILILLLIILSILAYTQSSKSEGYVNPNINQKLRKLFTDHAVWTKIFIDAFLSNLPPEQITLIVQRLKQNQDDIGNGVRPFVGNQKANLLAKLLWEHIQSASATAISAKEKRPDLQNKINLQMMNSDQVAQALSNLNPQKLPYPEMQRMFRIHNQYVIDQVVAGLNKDWKKLNQSYDEYYNEILDMADMISMAL